MHGFQMGERNRQLIQHLKKKFPFFMLEIKKKNFHYIKEQKREGMGMHVEENMIDSLWWGSENGFLAIIQDQAVKKK